MSSSADAIEIQLPQKTASRRIFSRLVVFLVLASVAALGWIIHRTRHTIQAHWYWHKWTRATSDADREAWRDRFFCEPNLEEKLAVALALAGSETPHQTYWLVTGRAAKSHDALIVWARLFVPEAAHNWELLQLRLHALRWIPPERRPAPGPASTGDYLNETDEMLQVAATADLAWPELQAVLPFLEVCGLTGRSDLTRGANVTNWRERFQSWHEWYRQHRDYLRWDDVKQVLVLDAGAFGDQTPLPQGYRRIAPALTPLPGWTGDAP